MPTDCQGSFITNLLVRTQFPPEDTVMSSYAHRPKVPLDVSASVVRAVAFLPSHRSQNTVWPFVLRPDWMGRRRFHSGCAAR